MSLKVKWLSGTEDVLYNVAVNQSLTIIEGSSLSVDEFDVSNLISVYPNPSKNGLFQVNSDKLDRNKEYRITVYDTLGRVLFEEKVGFVHDYVNLEEYSKGIYFLQIKSDNQSVVKKLIYN